jgi:hypothetical protein
MPTRIAEHAADSPQLQTTMMSMGMNSRKKTLAPFHKRSLVNAHQRKPNTNTHITYAINTFAQLIRK